MIRDYRPRLLFPRPKRKNTFEYSVEFEDMNGDKWRFAMFATNLWSARVQLASYPPVLCGELIVTRIWRRNTNDINYVRESWTRK